MKLLKPTKKPNPNRREIVVTFRVNAEEMKYFLANAHAYTGGIVSEWLRYAGLKHKPKKEDFKK